MPPNGAVVAFHGAPRKHRDWAGVSCVSGSAHMEGQSQYAADMPSALGATAFARLSFVDALYVGSNTISFPTITTAYAMVQRGESRRRGVLHPKPSP